MEERNDFLLKDFRCKASDVKGIFLDPSSFLLCISFNSVDLFECHSTCLSAGVPWTACANALVYGWAPDHTVTSIRVSVIPNCFQGEAIHDHFQQFGRITHAVHGYDRFLKSAFNSIVHLSHTLSPGLTLPLPLQRLRTQTGPSPLGFLCTSTITAVAVPTAATLAMLASSVA